MILIKVLQYWTKSEEPVNFPEITINSIASKIILYVSSTSGKLGKCLFAFTMSLLSFRYLIRISYLSLDSVFKADFFAILFIFCKVCIFSLFYLKYNHNFAKKVQDLWYDLRIEHDYETRKYFWTRKVIYYSLQATCYAGYIIHDACLFYHIRPDADSERLQNVLYYWETVLEMPILYYYVICHHFILLDLSVLAQTAIQYLETQSERIYKESLKGRKVSNFKAIHDLRLKYLQTHLLVNKMNKLMSPGLFVYLVLPLDQFIKQVYSVLFVQQSQLLRIHRVIGCIAALILAISIIHSTAQVYLKSQALLMTVYKLSMKTDYSKVLNEITLFVNCDEIGFYFGGICTITYSTITTTFSLLATLIISMPSFAG
uniref:Gustatory receptor n=1 Tax=Tetranychus urticae TaxID=32264 RepID=T1KIK4_TETUR